MEKNEMWLWVVTIYQAQQGDKEAQEAIAVENRLRQEQGRPTLEEELKAAADSM